MGIQFQLETEFFPSDCVACILLIFQMKSSKKDNSNYSPPTLVL